MSTEAQEETQQDFSTMEELPTLVMGENGPQIEQPPQEDDDPAAEPGTGEGEAAIPDEQAAESEAEQPLPPDINAIAKQVGGLEELSKKWGNEIGEMRSMNQQVIAALQALQQQQYQPQAEQPKQDDDIYTDPNSFVDKRVAARLRQQQEQQLQEQQRLNATKSFITQRFPEFEQSLDDIAARAKQLLGEAPGIENQIAAFRANPYGENALAMLAFADAVKLAKENAKLKGELESASKGGRRLAENISKAQRQRPTVGQTNGAAPQTRNADALAANRQALSDDELQEALQSTLQQLTTR